MSVYDYIIIGSGASGLLLADALGKDAFFRDASILILDKTVKNKNDRTWCFWETGNGEFDTILQQKWANIRFAGKEIDVSPAIQPYQYKMLRGLDFYEHYLNKLETYPNIALQKEEVVDISQTEGTVSVNTTNQSYRAKTVFDSRFDYTQLKNQNKYPVLQQHFLGWFIKTEKAVFEEETATFMDFTIPQKGNTRFMYVLPFSKNEALVEYTLFSENTLEKKEYERALEAYIKNLDCGHYEITDTERGNIPMSCYDFSKDSTNRYLKIGIAGGWAKASTGFTFYNTTKEVRVLIDHLKAGKPLSTFHKKNRFWFYDLLFLDVLHQNNHLGSAVFEALFKKRSPQLVLKFLDEGTTLWEEVAVMWACPKIPFFKVLLKRMFRYGK